MSDRIDRFKKMQERKKNHKYFIADKNIVNKIESSIVDNNSISSFEEQMDSKFNIDLTNYKENPKEIEDLITSINKKYDKKQLENLISESKSTVIDNIIKPFGIGKHIIAKFDKNGGNVTTIHNAKKGIYANKNDEYNRKDYANSKNSNANSFAGSGKNSIGSEFTKNQIDNQGNLKDAYTNKTEKASNTSPDHIASLSEFHKNGGYMKSTEEKANFATDKDNLASTRRDINQSMKDTDKKEWIEKKQGGRDKKNKDYYDIDEKELNNQYEKGLKTTNKHTPSFKEKAKFYTKDTAKSSVSEGAKMGFQQAIGIVLKELTESIYDEIVDIYKNGFKGENKLGKTFWNVLKIRFTRIGKKILSKWKDVFKAFGEGCLSGLISNIITVIINIFTTTGKRVVRIIREGFFSLLKALKLLFSPPKDMTYKEAMHEASKLLVAGAIIGIGIAVEDTVEKFIIASIPFLAPFADIISTVFICLISGLTTTLLVFLIDKLDIFGVNKKNKIDYVLNQLNEMTEDSYEEIEKIIISLKPIKI